MRIEKFTFDRNLVSQFLEFGYDIYKGDDNWIAPLRSDINRQLSARYFFYNKTGNQHCHFLLYQNGNIRGRITALINSDLRDGDGTPVGTLGFFECQPDYDFASKLLEVATEWLMKRNIRKIWGPMNFDIWHNYRFMTRGFDLKPFYGEPYNKEYYPGFFETFGFNKVAEWDSVEVIGRDILNQMMLRGAKRFRLLSERGYHFEPVDINNFDNEIEKLRQIMVASFAGFIGFTPLKIEELKELFRKAYHAINPRMFIFVYNPADELCGFAVALLELADAVRVMKGRSDIWARSKFLYRKRFVSKINFYIGGITPEEIKNRSGLGRAGFYYILNEMLQQGYDTLLLTLRLKGNAAHALPGRLSPVPQKEYALYQVEL